MKTHGQSKSKIYRVWTDMKQRCFNPNDTGFENWGGRGISVCAEWLNFENFFAWAEPLWKKGLQLDRLDNNQNYSPENCWFTTKSFQSINKRPAPKSSSGIKGISWDKQKNKWRCRIYIEGKEQHLGFFNSIEMAKEARDIAVRNYKAMIAAAQEPT